MIFLSIGEKIKECRKLYGIKQTAFERYGITQNYLSLIENGKRVPSQDILKAIYEGFVELTNEAIKGNYSEFEFCQLQEDKVKLYLIEALKQELWIDQQDKLIELAKQFNLDDMCYEIYYKLGCNCKDRRLYNQAHVYLQEAAYYALQINKPVAMLYKIMGSSLKLGLNYEGALACYVMASQYAIQEGNMTLFYHVKCNIGTVLFNLSRYESALECANEVILKCEDATIYGIAVLLKSNILMKTECFEEAEILLNTFIHQTEVTSHSTYATYNLGCIYTAQHQYDKGLEIALNLLNQEGVDEDTKKKAVILVSYMYVNQEQYKEANEFLQYLRRNFKSVDDDHRIAVWYYKISLDIYIALDDKAAIIDLLNYLKEMLNCNQIQPEQFIEVQNKFLNYIIKKNHLEGYDRLDLS